MFLVASCAEEIDRLTRKSYESVEGPLRNTVIALL